MGQTYIELELELDSVRHASKSVFATSACAVAAMAAALYIWRKPVCLEGD